MVALGGVKWNYVVIFGIMELLWFAHSQTIVTETTSCIRLCHKNKFILRKKNQKKFHKRKHFKLNKFCIHRKWYLTIQLIFKIKCGNLFVLLSGLEKRVYSRQQNLFIRGWIILITVQYFNSATEFVHTYTHWNEWSASEFSFGCVHCF